MTENDITLLNIYLRRSVEILEKPFFKFEPRWVAEGIFTLLMIEIKDCLQILKKLGKEISFIDDPDVTKQITVKIQF